MKRIIGIIATFALFGVIILGGVLSAKVAVADDGDNFSDFEINNSEIGSQTSTITDTETLDAVNPNELTGELTGESVVNDANNNNDGIITTSNEITGDNSVNSNEDANRIPVRPLEDEVIVYFDIDFDESDIPTPGSSKEYDGTPMIDPNNIVFIATDNEGTDLGDVTYTISGNDKNAGEKEITFWCELVNEEDGVDYDYHNPEGLTYTITPKEYRVGNLLNADGTPVSLFTDNCSVDYIDNFQRYDMNSLEQIIALFLFAADHEDLGSGDLNYFFPPATCQANKEINLGSEQGIAHYGHNVPLEFPFNDINYGNYKILNEQTVNFTDSKINNYLQYQADKISMYEQGGYTAQQMTKSYAWEFIAENLANDDFISFLRDYNINRYNALVHFDEVVQRIFSDAGSDIIVTKADGSRMDAKVIATPIADISDYQVQITDESTLNKLYEIKLVDPINWNIEVTPSDSYTVTFNNVENPAKSEVLHWVNGEPTVVESNKTANSLSIVTDSFSPFGISVFADDCVGDSCNGGNGTGGTGTGDGSDGNGGTNGGLGNTGVNISLYLSLISLLLLVGVWLKPLNRRKGVHS